MEVGVRVEAENPLTGERRHTATAYLTFVALDAGGPADCRAAADCAESEAERRRYQQAEQRRIWRLERRRLRDEEGGVKRDA
jgi:acyl-CoA hydrolase